MKAIEVGVGTGLNKLAVVEREPTQPGAGEIQVQWKASSLNFHDYLVANGSLAVPEGRIPMSDGAGEIVAVGAGVDQWQVGDKVISLFFPNWQSGGPTPVKTAALTGETIDGCAIEQSCVKATDVTRIPEGYSFAEAATLPCAALTAWRGLMVEGGLQAGQTVLVQGTGGMSIFALQLVKAAGAYVYATSSSDEKVERLQAMGADHVLNYKTDASWGKTVLKHSGGGVDHVLDVGGSMTLDHSTTAVKMGGHIALIGILGGFKAEVMLPKLFGKQIRLTGLAVGGAEMQQNMVNALEVGQIKPVLDRSFSLDQVADAFRYQETNQHFGKILLEY